MASFWKARRGTQRERAQRRMRRTGADGEVLAADRFRRRCDALSARVDTSSPWWPTWPAHTQAQALFISTTATVIHGRSSKLALRSSTAKLITWVPGRSALRRHSGTRLNIHRGRAACASMLLSVGSAV